MEIFYPNTYKSEAIVCFRKCMVLCAYLNWELTRVNVKSFEFFDLLLKDSDVVHKCNDPGINIFINICTTCIYIFFIVILFYYLSAAIGLNSK